MSISAINFSALPQTLSDLIHYQDQVSGFQLIIDSKFVAKTVMWTTLSSIKEPKLKFPF